MDNKFKWIDKIEGNIVFGSGGIGDALFLLSCYLGKIENLSIIFWANNKQLIDTFFSIFQNDNISENYRIKQKVVFNKWQSREMFDTIISHEKFCGKGHIPDNLNFIEEWSKNYEKYLSEIQSDFKSKLIELFPPTETIKLDTNKEHIGLHLFGSSEDNWKRKCVTNEEFTSIINKFKNNNSIYYLFGSKNDKENYPIEQFNLNNFIDVRGESFETHFKTIASMNKIISVDSWIKTYSSLVNIDTTVIKNEYNDAYISKIFTGHNIDPADNIFLNTKFNFKFTTFKEISS